MSPKSEPWPSKSRIFYNETIEALKEKMGKTETMLSGEGLSKSDGITGSPFSFCFLVL